MTLDDYKPSISQLSATEAYAIHQAIRLDRFVSKKAIQEEKKETKRMSSRFEKTIRSMSEEQLEKLLEELQ
ncbi:MAG: hypothetical protein CO041_04315 [Candidatus Pacebacteria bacterium CG_4_9_14_0_2_um_filter_40_15]|nr:MAG: hypothetical protein COY01_03005 [Candidatus Pacebacteria bacterium CG_4_10_14_0_2_um_filter_40_20]PJC41499.1 MAG: hypothetical protein CO041_04315 [Candidatus Pacebacteria bacterium CG_4_9_14_0_2_um_filter_40_15]